MFAENRELDLICLGRLGVDLNCNDHNCQLYEVSSFSPTVGGSPANIAIGAAKLGAKVGFIGRVSNDKFGTFICNKLSAFSVDTTGVCRDDRGAKNCLAITEIVTPRMSGSILYRDNVADLNLTYEDIREDYIAKAKVLLISGTALAASPSREAVFLAAYYAKAHDVFVVLDLDYRAYTWSCPEESSLYYRMFSEKCDCVIGNEDEIRVMEKLWYDTPFNGDLSAKRLMADGVKLVIIKYGENGSTAWTADGQKVECGIYPAELKKTFGSGDAYAAGLITGLTHGKSLFEAMADGSAAASIVVSRYNCSESSPTAVELAEYMAQHTMRM